MVVGAAAGLSCAHTATVRVIRLRGGSSPRQSGAECTCPSLRGNGFDAPDGEDERARRRRVELVRFRGGGARSRPAQAGHPRQPRRCPEGELVLRQRRDVARTSRDGSLFAHLITTAERKDKIADLNPSFVRKAGPLSRPWTGPRSCFSPLLGSFLGLRRPQVRAVAEFGFEGAKTR